MPILRQSSVGGGDDEQWQPLLGSSEPLVFAPLNPLIPNPVGPDGGKNFAALLPKLRRLAVLLDLELPYRLDPSEDHDALVALLDSAGAEAVEERTGRVTWFGLDDGGDVYAFFPYDTDGPDRLLTRARRAVQEEDAGSFGDAFIQLDTLARNGILPGEWLIL